MFRVEDTEGEALKYEKLELPDFPLRERAEEWGISVKTIPGNYRYYGYYTQGRKEIALATPEESVFFHELAHAAQEKVKGALKTGQDPYRRLSQKSRPRPFVEWWASKPGTQPAIAIATFRATQRNSNSAPKPPS